MVNLPEEENTPEKRVNKIFDIMDKVNIINGDCLVLWLLDICT